MRHESPPHLYEPSLGEVIRRVEGVHQDLEEDVCELGVRLDGKVSLDVFELRLSALDQDVQGWPHGRPPWSWADRERARQRAADRRGIFSALIVPVLPVALEAYMATRGAGS